MTDVTKVPERDLATGFRDVDRTGDPGFGPATTCSTSAAGWATTSAPSLVGPTGRAVGIDASEAMIAEARKRSEDTGLPVDFVVGDACCLDLPDGSFDACRRERTSSTWPSPSRQWPSWRE